MFNFTIPNGLLIHILKAAKKSLLELKGIAITIVNKMCLPFPGSQWDSVANFSAETFIA